MADKPQYLTDEQLGIGKGDNEQAPKQYLKESDLGIEPPARGLKGWAQDIAATAVKGAIAVPEMAVGLADIPTGGRVGKFLENEDGIVGFRPKQAREFVNDWHSDATKEAQRKFQEADGIWDKTKTAVQNPSLVATSVGESLPSMIAGGVIGRGLLGATKYGAMAANAGKLSAADAAALKAAQVTAGAVGEGATMAGSAAEQIRQETNDGLLTPMQSGAALGTGVMGTAASRMSGGLANRLGIGEADTMLVQGMKGVAADVASAKSIPRQVIEGAITEGLLEELPQSVGEQIIQNLALGKNWTEGLDDAAVLGTLSGGLMGAGAAGAHGALRSYAPTPQQAATQEPQQQEPIPAAPLQLGNTPDPLISFRDGTVARQSEIDAHLASLPERERQTFVARILGYAPQEAVPPIAAQTKQTEVVRPTSEPMVAEVLTPKTVQTPATPSQRLGLDPNAGALSAAAAVAVDSGATEKVQGDALAQAAAEIQDKKAGDKPLSRTAQVADPETGEVPSRFANWTDEELQAQFRNAQAPSVRNELAQEIQLRRELDLQDELDQENALAEADNIPDNTFASINSITDEGWDDSAEPVTTKQTPQQPTVKREVDGTETPQAKQAEAQPTQAGRAQAGQPAEGLSNASATTENDGAQAAPAARPQAQAQGEAQPVKPVKATKADLDHLFGVDKKRAAAIERVNSAKGAFFFSEQKAKDFVKNNGIADTHEVVQQNRAFHVKAKGQQVAQPSQAAAPDARKAERDRRIKSQLQSGGYVQGNELRTNNGMTLMKLTPEELSTVPADSVRQPPNAAQMAAAATAGKGTSSESEPVVGLYTGKPDHRNSKALTELDGFKVGDQVDVHTRTIGRSTIETLFFQDATGFGKPMSMARIVGADGKRLDVLTSELGHPKDAATVGKVTSNKPDKDGKTIVGRNSDGATIYQREDGRREYDSGNATIREPKQIRVTRAGVTVDDFFGRRDDFMTVDELAERDGAEGKAKKEAKPAPAATAGESEQFKSYSDWIEKNGAPPVGMREQIERDARLEDGEAERLLASAKQAAKAPSADKTSAKADLMTAEESAERDGEKPKQTEAATGNVQQAIRDAVQTDHLTNEQVDQVAAIFDRAENQAKNEQPNTVAATEPKTVSIPQDIDEALTKDMQKQQARVKRLRAQAEASDLDLEGKKAAQLKATAAEATLRKMRLSRFDAEDAVQASIKAGNPGPFSAHADLFPQAQQALVQHLLAAPGAPVDVQQTLKGAVSTDHLTNDQVAQVEAMTNKAKMPQRKSPGDPGYTLLDARNDLIDLRNQSEAQGIVADDRLAERVRRQEKLVAEMEAEETAASAKPAPKKKPSADQVRAQADLMNALADLGDILGKNTRMNIVPEQEQKLLPVLTRVLDAAFRLGYHKFKDAAKFSLDQIRQHLGKESADAITLDHLQGAYIAMAGGKQGVDTKRAVIDVESKAEIEAHEAVVADEQEAADNDNKEVKSDERNEIQSTGTQALEPVATRAGEVVEGSGRAGIDATDRSGKRTESGAGVDGAGLQGARSGGSGTERVHPPETRDGGGLRKPRRVAKSADKAASEQAIGTDTRPEVAGEPASAPNVPAADFQITDETRLGQGGEVAKFNDNLAAIRTLKAIEEANRRATPEEQAVLARYVGWGGLANAFPDPLTGEYKSAWSERGKELRELLDEAEFAAARRSTRNAHYTSKPVVQAMWKAVERLGFKGGLALETSMGVGNFLGLKPQGTPASFIGVEYDSLTSRIAQSLYPQATVLHSGFQDVPLADNAFALSIGNPPFGSESLRFQYKPELAGVSIHNQFFRASMDALRPGGIQAMVVSRFLMDAKDKSTRLELAKQAKLIAAIRLPDTAFKENARTEVVTDIIILQKLDAGEQAAMSVAVEEYKKLKAGKKGADAQAAAMVPVWVETADMADPLGGEPMTVNAYFEKNKANILGVMERSGSMQHGADITVRLDDPASMESLLAQAVERLPQNIQNFGADVLDATEKRHKSMSDALRIALSGLEVGHVQLNRDGVIERVVERETPEGGIEMGMQLITAASPWSDQLMQDADGHWYYNDVVKDAEGKPVKVVMGGKTTRNNLTERIVFKNEADVPEKFRLGKTGMERLQAAVVLRDSLKRQIVLETADAAKGVMNANRKELAKRYDAFVEKFGPVNRPSNLSYLMTMPDGGLIAALEVSYQAEITAERAKKSGLKATPEKVVRAPILSERVVPKYEPATKADSASDALAITLSERGRVDVERIAQLRGLSADEALSELQAGAKPLVFLDPETQQWETADAYLSGNVRRKLNAAKVARADANVSALEAVQPEAWGAEAVTVMLGSTWVPPKVYADFAEYLSGGKAKVQFSPVSNTFTLTVNGSTSAARDWSSEGASVDYILSRLMNSQPVVVTVKNEDGKSVRHEEFTKLAQLKAKEISAEFLDWVFKDGERRTALVDLFNEKFNTRVVRQRDGSHLKLPGKVPDSVINMRRHQKNVIWRGITDNALLMDHAVGAGKTFAAIARAMERRRMGLSKKPMIVVPNHLVDQWESDIYRLYPGAKVLAAGKKDFEKQRRRRLFGKIATGDWDIVVVPHSSFGFIGIDAATEQRFLQMEMDQAVQAVKDAEDQAREDGIDNGRRKPFGVKEAERLVEKIQTRMDKLNSGNKDRLLTFEQMGVDDLTVDEAHEFKNLYYSSRMTGVRGMGDKTGSRKANDLYNKVRSLQENPASSVAFLTGTPISNSAVEMYTIMRYLAPKQLKDMGLEHFDAWRAQFVEASAAFEPTESGSLKEVTRLGRSWSNMRSLMDLYYEFTDAVSLEDIQRWYSEDNGGKPFPVPKVKGGERKLVNVKPTAAQEAELKETIAGFDGLKDIQDPYERNAARLRLMDRARKLSLDVRAVDPRSSSDEAGGKLDRASREIKRIYDQWSADRGAQMVFLDRSVPKAKGDDKVIKEYDALVAKRDEALAKDDTEGFQNAQDALDKFDANEISELRNAQAGGWNAYQQIKDNLIAMGVPANEIRFIQEANNDEQKQALFDAVNSGQVRVLIGSSQRMGAGTNAQKRLVGLHHIDVTWKPSDIEQREGRIIRQGNELLAQYGDGFEVEILAYATERTVDAKMWDLNATKLKTINGIRKYDGAFSMDFEDEDSVSMAEMAALASGNPLLLERVKTDSEINMLELQERAFRRRMYGAQDALQSAQRAISQNPKLIERAKAQEEVASRNLQDAKARKEARKVEIEGKEYDSLISAYAAAKEAIEVQQAGKANARYSVAVDGKRVSSKEAIDAAIGEALGDAALFEAEIGGRMVIQRTAAARELAARLNTLTKGIVQKDSRTETVGSMMGFDLVLDSSAYSGHDGNTLVDSALSLVSKEGETVTSLPLSTVMVNQSYVTSNLTNATTQLFNSVERLAEGYGSKQLQRQLDRAKAELPELQSKVGQSFPKAEELAAKRERLRELVSLLDGSKAAPVEDSAETTGDVALKADEEGFGTRERAKAGTPTDRAVMDMVRDGKAAEDVLRLIAGTSRSKFNKQVARLLLKTGAAPSVHIVGDLGSKDGFKHLAKYSRKNHALSMTEAATGRAEQIFLHEMIHAATLMALDRKSLPSVQMRVLFNHVKKQGGAAGQYGMTNVGEFVSEAFTNPKFQQALRGMKAPAQSPLHSAWDYLVRTIKSILGLPHDSTDALSAALEIGVSVMRENMALRKKGVRGSGAAANAGIDQTETPEFKRWFGDSKVVDADGKPLVVYHGTQTDIDFTSFNPLSHFGTKEQANDIASSLRIFAPSAARGYSQRVIPAFLRIENPIRISDTGAGHKATDYLDALMESGQLEHYQYEQIVLDDDENRIYEESELIERIIDHLENRGYDGFVYENDVEGEGSSYVPFRPNQIKSATGNNGNFDPENDDIAYFGAAEVRDIKTKAIDQLDRVLSHPGKVSLWDKTVGTMRHLAEREESFKPVFETAQGFIDDVSMLANDASDRAPRLLPRVEGLGDIFGRNRKKTISAQDSKAVAAPLFQGTLNWGRDLDGKPAQVSDLKEKYEGKSADDKAQMMLKTGQLDPEILKMWQGMQTEQYEKAIATRFENTFLKGGVVWKDAELVEHFKATPQQISLYREARAAIDRSIDMTARADMLRLLGEDYEHLRDVILDAPSLDQATALLLDTLEEDAKADFDSRDRLADLMHGVRQRQEKASDLMKAGYAPLSRFGRYTVDVVGANGKREYFGMFESIKESNAMFADMKKAFPNAEVKQGTISQEEFKLFAGVTPESLELFGNMLGLEGDGNEARDKAFQKYLQLTKNNHSALKRLIHRQGIAGYSEDVGRVLASFVYSNARQAAGGLSAGKMERAISEIPKGKGELRDVAMGLRSYIQDPQEEGQAIRGMLFAQYLGGSVASAMVNMTQPFAVTMPYLSQFGGMAQSGAHLAKAFKDMATKGFKYETDLANAMQHAEDDGIVSPQEIHQLMGQARGAGGLRVGDGTKLGDAKATAANNWEKLKVLWGQPFALAEQFNRRSTFIAAFRIAKEQGMANPAEFARKAVLDTQFLFSKANKPKWARGAIGGTLFTFKSYSVSYLELLQRTWNAGAPGGPERKAGRRAVAWSMAMLMMMGGAGGLPFMEDLEDLIDGIAQMMGLNFSTKQKRQEFLREYLGKEFAEFIENGMSGLPGAPIDVSGRLGMGNLIPGTGLLLTKQNRERDLLEVIGPAGDLVKRGFTGAGKALTGDIAGAAMEVSPTAVRNVAKGWDMGWSGMYKDAKGYKVIDTTLDEAIAKAAGFQPRSVAEIQEANSFMMRSKSFYSQTSGEIKAQWADAIFRKDDAALERVRERLAAWNRDNPDQPIVVKIPDIMKRVREMGKDRTQRIADTAPKALRAQMRDMAREASM